MGLVLLESAKIVGSEHPHDDPLTGDEKEIPVDYAREFDDTYK